MCGIFGLITNKKTINETAIEQALERIRHRGPDASGYSKLASSVCFGHVRLSVLDLSERGAQPMTSSCGRFTITYNGEVYNYRELAKQFALPQLKSTCDTEVILELFATLGTKAIEKLNGMFAFAIRDNYKEKTYLVRDRLGIKPCFYSVNQDAFCFGSEIKAVRTISETGFSINKEKLHEWLYYGNSLGEESLHTGILNLEPGTFLEIHESSMNISKVKYWAPKKPVSRCEEDTDKLISKNRVLLEQAVQRQLVSDVPVGIFLSGGIDSSAITAFGARHYDGKLKTYSAGFDFDNGNNELEKAAALAKEFNTEHYEMHIKGIDVADIVEKMVAHHDQPFSDAANIPLYLLCDKIKGSTKVVLQGDGGDELYGGYKRYNTLGNLGKMKFAARLGKIANFFLPRNQSYYVRKRYINALLADSDWKLMALLLTVEDEGQQPTRVFDKVLRKEVIEQSAFSRYQELQSKYQDIPLDDQMALIDSQIILPDIFLEKVDRSTMAASVEVRVPFLDNDLVEFAQSIPSKIKTPNGHQKWLLKKSLDGIVPNDVLYGPKKGFGVPFGFWLSTALKELLFESVKKANKIHPNTFDINEIEILHNALVSKTEDCSFLLWKVMNMAIWLCQNER